MRAPPEMSRRYCPYTLYGRRRRLVGRLSQPEKRQSWSKDRIGVGVVEVNQRFSGETTHATVERGVPASCLRLSSHLRGCCRPIKKRVSSINGRFNPRSNPMALVCNRKCCERLRQNVLDTSSVTLRSPVSQFFCLVGLNGAAPIVEGVATSKGGRTDVGGAGSGEPADHSRKTIVEEPTLQGSFFARRRGAM